MRDAHAMPHRTLLWGPLCANGHRKINVVNVRRRTECARRHLCNRYDTTAYLITAATTTTRDCTHTRQ